MHDNRWSVFINWATTHDVPDGILVFVKDLIEFKKRASPVMLGTKTVCSFMTVRYHNKIIKMLQLPIRDASFDL